APRRPSASRHRASFPTRRASDLIEISESNLSLIPENGNLTNLFPTLGLNSDEEMEDSDDETAINNTDADADIEINDDDTTNESRSEEHTSELQSRFDLVCRLLLG